MMENQFNHSAIKEIMYDSPESEVTGVIRFLEANKDTIFFPKKYLGGIKYTTGLRLDRLHAENPDMPLVNVVITLLTGLNEKLPPEMILEITTFIIEEWQKLSVPKPQKVGELHLP